MRPPAALEGQEAAAVACRGLLLLEPERTLAFKRRAGVSAAQDKLLHSTRVPHGRDRGRWRSLGAVTRGYTLSGIDIPARTIDVVRCV